MNFEKSKRNVTEKSTLDAVSDTPKSSSKNLLINKDKVVDKDLNVTVVQENQAKHPVEVPNLEIKPKNDTPTNNTEPVVDDVAGQKGIKFRLKIQDRIFEIDRDTIYNKSKFLHNVLLKREFPNETPFIVEGVKASTFEPISKWMHSGEIAIGPENIGNILEVAIKLEIEDVVKTCLKFSDLMLESVGMMRTYELAIKYDMNEIKQAALSRMQVDFLKLSKSPMFLDYDVNQACLLLDDSELHIDSENDVLDACTYWLSANWERRQEHLVRILDCVRFPLLSKTTLVNLATGGIDNETEWIKEVWKHADTQKKVFDALIFKAGLQCELSRKVVYQKPKLRKNMKRISSSGNLIMEKLDNENQAAIKLQAGLRGYNSRKLLAKRNEAAKKIQVWYRKKEIELKTNLASDFNKQHDQSNKPVEEMPGN